MKQDNVVLSVKKDILLYLSKRQIKSAFDALMTLASELQDWQIIERLNEIETNYKFMLHYLFEGVEDTEREHVYNGLVRSLYEITDDVCDALQTYDSTNIFYEKARNNELKNPISLDDFLSRLRDISQSILLLNLNESNEEQALKLKNLNVSGERVGLEMFNTTFASHRTTDNEFDSYIRFIDSADIPERDRCLFISALTMNLFHRFDSRKLQVLMHASQSDNISVRARAIVGLVITLQMYDTRWDLYPELKNILDSLAENPDFRKSVLRVIIQLIQSRETEKISKKITEEIIPEMMRFNSLAGKKLNLEDLMSENDFSEKNPEWQKELEESGLANKLQEYSNMQLEGADVFHSTFAGLKHFSFFHELGNWFLPFDTSYSEISGLFPDQKDNLLKMAIVDSSHMCDSDKYSFCLSLLQISAAQRNHMMQQLGAESEQIKELQNDAKAMNRFLDEEIISNQYIQNLYRFFKLYPYRNNFFDIFRLRLNFYDKKSIAPLISDPDSMRKVAFFCFDKNYFHEALEIFDKLVLIDETGGVWQKIGYCRQMLNDLQGAIDAYLQADLLTPNNSWILKRVAHIYRSLKQPELSLEYYEKAAQITPDNLSLTLNIGHCYLELKEYEKALNCYFKVELLDEKNDKALRPIAWTAFLLHKFDLSKKYYQDILNKKATIHDYLNAGHVELCIKNIPAAINLYKKAAEQEPAFDKFIELFEADKDVLLEAGVDGKLFPFLLDMIQYKVEKKNKDN